MSKPWDKKEEEHPSKSELKRRSLELQRLGERLVELRPDELDTLPLGEKLRDAIDAARGMNKRGALTRQRQYIGRLMREIDPEPVRFALASRGESKRERARAEHEIEMWRERLLQDEPAAWKELRTHVPAEEMRMLKSLARQAHAENNAARPPAASRKLFRKLREILQPGESGN